MPYENDTFTDGSLFDCVVGRYKKQNLDVEDTAGFAAVHHAAHRNLKDHTQLLLRRGANPKPVDATGHTPVEIAITRGFDALTRLPKHLKKRLKICLSLSGSNWRPFCS